VTLCHEHDAIVLTCWGEKGTVLRGIHPGHVILHVTNVAVQTFAGKIRCNTTFGSIISVNPTGFEPRMFLPSSTSSAAPGSQLLSAPNVPVSASSASAQLTNLRGIQEHLAPLCLSEKSVFGAVVVCLEDINLNHPYIIQCPNCKKSVSPFTSSMADDFFQDDLSAIGTCAECGVSTTLLLKVPCSFIDSTGNLAATLWGEVGASFVGYTADQLASFDQMKRYEIRRSLVWKRFYVEFSLYSKDPASPLCLSVKSISHMPTTLL
jgi:hypothetical protein